MPSNTFVSGEKWKPLDLVYGKSSFKLNFLIDSIFCFVLFCFFFSILSKDLFRLIHKKKELRQNNVLLIFLPKYVFYHFTYAYWVNCHSEDQRQRSPSSEQALYRKFKLQYKKAKYKHVNNWEYMFSDSFRMK